MEAKSQIKASLSNVMMTNNFYHRSMSQLHEILNLLEMPETNDANSILEYTKMGLIRLYEQYFQNFQKQKLIAYLFHRQKFSTVSKQTKEYILTLLNQTHVEVVMKLQQQKSMMQMMHMANPSVPGNMPTSPFMCYPYHNQPTGIPSSYVPPEMMQKYSSEDMKKFYEQYQGYYAKNQFQTQPPMNQNLSKSNQAISPVVSQQNDLNQQRYSQIAPNDYMRNMSQMGFPNNYHVNPNPYMSPNPYMGSHQYPMSYPPMQTNAMGDMSPYFNRGGFGVNSRYQEGQNRNSFVENNKEPQIQNSRIPQPQTHKTIKLAEQARQISEEASKQKSAQHTLSKNPYCPPSVPVPASKLAAKSTQQSQQLQKQTTSKPKPNANSSLSRPVQVSSKPVNVFLPKEVPFKDVTQIKQPNVIFQSCSCRGFYVCEDSFVCPCCQRSFHFKCLRITVRKSNLDTLICAHCKLRDIDPLNRAAQYLGEYYLTNLNESIFESVINFKSHLEKFKKDINKYQIQIRCIRSGEHLTNPEITWPDECIIKINSEKIIDIPALQSNSSLKKRKDYSVCLTHSIYAKNTTLIHQSMTSNLERTKITVELRELSPQEAAQKKLNNSHNFALGIYLIEKLSPEELYTSVMNEDHCRNQGFIKNIMKNSQAEVEINQITIKLLDPFSWETIETPVRGWKCTHAQCFDLKTFISLMSSAKNRTWKCPVCSKDSRKFMIDFEQKDLLKKATDYFPLPKEVEIFKNGTIAFKVDIDKQSQSQEEKSQRSITKTKKIYKAKKQGQQIDEK